MFFEEITLNRRVKFIFISLLIVLIGCTKQSYKTEIIPINNFFKNPQNSQYVLSTDGNNLAYLKPWKNRLNIFVKNLSTKVETQLTKEENADIQKIFWANKSHIIYSIDRYRNDNNSLIAISVDTKQINELSNSKNTNAYVINILPEFENEIIIQTNERDSTVFDVYRINLLNGNRQIIGQNPGNITAWLTDNNGKLRVAVSTNGVTNTILFRDDETLNFKEVKKVPFYDVFFPISFSADNKYVLSYILKYI